MNDIWLGIDTSNYTTSVCAITEDNKYFSVKRPLFVKPSEKGVRQSDAVFMHVKNLPSAFSELFDLVKGEWGNNYCVKAVGVSSTPRTIEGSYMPCFLSGVSAASCVAEAMNVPLYCFSHQEGHVRAAIFGADIDVPDTFYSFHLSGGTCELLKTQKNEFGFNMNIISESQDITLGQLVDRVGVMLGLDFPCGVHLEKLAKETTRKIKICGNEKINISGFENKAKAMHEKKQSKEEISSYVYSVILAAIDKMLESRDDTSLPVVFAGGVSGSRIVQSHASNVCNAYFAHPALSSDNAVGIAILTKEKFLKVN